MHILILRLASITPRKAAAALLLVALVASVSVASAADTPTAGSNGDCWRGGNYWCRNTWAGRSTNIYFRAIDQFSSSAPSWLPQAQTAVSNWNNAPGPQYYSWYPASNDTWVYWKYSQTGQDGLTSWLAGLTYNCDQ